VIDWWGLAHNALWIVGLAVILAAFSMASYRARVDRIPLRQELGGKTTQFPMVIGMVLFCLGLLLSSRSWWEKVIWGLAMAWFVVQAVHLGGRGSTGD
jgi:hypothetical protein